MSTSTCHSRERLRVELDSPVQSFRSLLAKKASFYTSALLVLQQGEFVFSKEAGLHGRGECHVVTKNIALQDKIGMPQIRKYSAGL